MKKLTLILLLLVITSSLFAQQYADLINNYEDTLFTVAEQSKIYRQSTSNMLIGMGVLYGGLGWSMGSFYDDGWAGEVGTVFYISGASIAGLGLLNKVLLTPQEKKADELIYRINSGIYTTQEDINRATAIYIEELKDMEKLNTLLLGGIIAAEGVMMMSLNTLLYDSSNFERTPPLLITGGILAVEGILYMLFYKGPFERFHDSFSSRLNK